MGFNLKVIIVAALMSMSGVKLSKADHDVELVPAQYITEHHIQGEAYDVNHFLLHLCGGCRYDKQNLKVLLILQKQIWNQENGDFLKATVLDSSGKAISTNQIGTTEDPKWVQTFSFTYYAFYGNLKLKVINGPGSGMMYAITVRFDQCNENCPDEQHSMSFKEAREQWKHKISAVESKENIHDLVPMFKTTESSRVETAELKYFKFDYCFPSASLNYNISIAVLASDSRSAFATYACPNGIADCKTYTAPYSDTASSSANIVTVPITGPENVGPVTVIVRGDGRFKDINSFTIAASKYSEVV